MIAHLNETMKIWATIVMGTLDLVCFVSAIFFGVLAAQIDALNEMIEGMPMWVQAFCGLAAGIYLIARSIKMVMDLFRGK